MEDRTLGQTMINSILEEIIPKLNPTQLFYIAMATLFVAALAIVGLAWFLMFGIDLITKTAVRVATLALAGFNNLLALAERWMNQQHRNKRRTEVEP